MYKLSHRARPGLSGNSRILGSSYTWIYIDRIRNGANRLPGKSRLLLIPLIIFELIINCIMLVIFCITIFAYLIVNTLFRVPVRNKRSVLHTYKQ